MRFYHFLNEQHTVLTLTKKRNTWILSDENNILLQTTKEGGDNREITRKYYIRTKENFKCSEKSRTYKFQSKW